MSAQDKSHTLVLLQCLCNVPPPGTESREGTVIQRESYSGVGWVVRAW